MFSIQSLLTIDTILLRKRLKMSDKKYLELVGKKAAASRRRGYKYNVSNRNTDFEILTTMGMNALSAEKVVKFAEKVDKVYINAVDKVEKQILCKQLTVISKLNLPANILRIIGKKCKNGK